MKKITLTQLIIGIGVVAIFVGILTYAKVNKDDNLKGEVVDPINDGNKVVLEEYSDFQCPACAAAALIVSQLKEKHGDKLEVRFNDFPLSFHQYAAKASEAAASARDQGKFWEYHDILFQNQSEWAQSKDEQEAVSYFKQYAKNLGLNTEEFNQSLDSGAKKAYVDGMTKIALDKKISATPTFYLNGKKLENYRTWNELIEMVEAKL